MKSSEKLLSSLRYYPWKQKRRAKLLREMAQTYVVLGTELFALGDKSGAKDNFSLGIKYRIKAEEIDTTNNPGYFDIQILCAGLCAGETAGAEFLASSLFSSFKFESFTEKESLSSEDESAVQKGVHGTCALLGWISRQPTDLIQRHADIGRAAGPPMEQFASFARCASAAIKQNEFDLQTEIDALAVFAAKQRRSGVFAQSEDSFLYLPGLGIVILARRDGLQVALPKSKQWSIEAISLGSL